MLDISGFQLASDICGDDEEETELLRPFADEAETYIRSFKWCPPIERMYFAFGIGGIIGLFLIEFSKPIGEAQDQELWVVVGDLPSAYFVTDDAYVPSDALEAYCELMKDWAEAVLKGSDVSECYPVEAAPTEEHARMLLSRIEYIREKIIPDM